MTVPGAGGDPAGAHVDGDFHPGVALAQGRRLGGLFLDAFQVVNRQLGHRCPPSGLPVLPPAASSFSDRRMDSVRCWTTTGSLKDSALQLAP